MSADAKTPPSTWKFAHPVNIYVYRNGVVGEKPQLVHISLDQKKCMNTVLEAIEKRMKLPIGYPIGLYNMDGTKVKKSYHLEMYNNYVVVTNIEKRFKLVDYGKVKDPMVIAGNDSKHVGTNKCFQSTKSKVAPNPKIVLERQDREDDENDNEVGKEGGNTGEISVYGIKSESRSIQCCSDEVMYIDEEEEEENQEDDVQHQVKAQVATAAAASAHLIDLIRRYTNVGSDIFKMFQDKIRKDLEKDLGPTKAEDKSGEKASTIRTVEEELMRLAQKSCHNTFGRAKIQKKRSPCAKIKKSASTSISLPPPSPTQPPVSAPPPPEQEELPLPEPDTQAAEVYTMTVDKPPVPHRYSESFQRIGSIKSLRKVAQEDMNNNSADTFSLNPDLLVRRPPPSLGPGDYEGKVRSNPGLIRGSSSLDTYRDSGRNSANSKYFPKKVLQQISSLLHQYDKTPPPLLSVVGSEDSTATYTLGDDRSGVKIAVQPAKVERACGSNCALKLQRNVCAQAGPPKVDKIPEIRVLPSTKEKPTRVGERIVDRFYNPVRYPYNKAANSKSKNEVLADSEQDFWAKNYGAGRYSRRRRKEAKKEQRQFKEDTRKLTFRQPTMPPPSPPEEFKSQPDELQQQPINYPYQHQPYTPVEMSSGRFPGPQFHFQHDENALVVPQTMSRTQPLPTPSTFHFVPQLPEYLSPPTGGTPTTGGSPFSQFPGMPRFVQAYPQGRGPVQFAPQPQHLTRLPHIMAPPQQQPQMMLLRNGQLVNVLPQVPLVRAPPAVMKPVGNDFQNNNHFNYINKLVRIPPPMYPIANLAPPRHYPQNQNVYRNKSKQGVN